MNTFNRKKFIESAEAYLAKRRQKWLDGVKGPLEPIALKFARRDWILPTEGLDAIRVQNLMPDCDIPRVADSIESGTPENEAKVYLANLASRNLKDVIEELQRFEEADIAANPEQYAVQIPSTAPEPEPAHSGEVRGYIGDITHSTCIKHTIKIKDGYSVYTFVKSLADTANAAKAQKVHMLATWVEGEFGCRLEKLTPINPPKLIEELVP